VLVTGKGDKQRNVPIEPSLEAVIEAYQTSRLRRFPTRGGRLPSRVPLFTGRDGTRMTRSALQHLVRSCYRWAGVYDRVERGTLVHALRPSPPASKCAELHAMHHSTCCVIGS
jgi:site-specific recombinase XerD